MACSSTQISSSSRARNFDVFVSFRGEDTRYGFTDHLFAALQRKSVVVFRDDQKLKKGELLEPELLQAIEGSRVFIVVFSKDYASSTWCMKELTKIVDWVEETCQSVLPVFYDITPSEVRKQSGKFEKAFIEHEERFKDNLEIVHKWREALKATTNRCGWDVQNKPQHEEIEKIVEEVINILGHNQILSFDGDIVDMDSRVKQMEELLDLDANEVVRVVGVCGMGGIGKTTLVTSLFNKIYSHYDTYCFIDDVSKIYGDLGPMGAQKQLLCQVLNQGNIEINNLPRGTELVRTRLRHLKTLIILDNIDQVEQLEKLALHPKYLGVGSRIIIISRDKQILRNYGVNEVYNVPLLNENKALQLFCRKAFKSDYILNDYEELTYDALKYVNGHPLAIKVFSSFLFGRNISQWKSALARLKESPNKDIMKVLRISYDGLQEMEKEIFLDIACFFHNGSFENEVNEHLAIRGFYPDIGIEVLVEKSLISRKETCDFLSFCKKIINMHDLLRELGKTIVREKSPQEPRKWSRLWEYKDLYNVMMENKDAKILEAIHVCGSLGGQTTLRVDNLSRMNHLKLLTLPGVKCSGILNYLPKELRYLNWHNYPFMSLPLSFHLEQLVELILMDSNIKQLWQGTKYLPNLKAINLSYSENLIEMPDLRGVPHLKTLDLEGCVEIMRIDPSIGILKELTFLNLKNCKNLLLDLNIISGLNSLETLNLLGCLKLQNSHLLKKSKETEHLEKVDKTRSVIQLSASSAFKVLMSPFHFLSSRKSEESFGLLLPYLPCFPCLIELDLSFCNLLQIPDAIGSLHSLVSLNLGGNKFVTLPNTIKQLFKLQQLNLEHCKQLEYLPELPTTKEKTFNRLHCWPGIYVFDCPKLSELEHCYRMVFSWMMQCLKVYLKSDHLPSMSIVIVIPGTQVPRWFVNQMGSSMRVDLSPVKDEPNWIGVACCALFVARDDHPTTIWRRDDHFAFVDVHNGQNRYFRSLVIPVRFKRDLVTVGLDHLLVMFFSRESLIEAVASSNGLHDGNTLRFSFDSLFITDVSLEEKAFGYRFLFEKDLQQFQSSMMLIGNSSSRKRKLLLTSD